MVFINVLRIALLIAAVGVYGLLLSSMRDPFEDLIDDIRIKDYLGALSDFGEMLVSIGLIVLTVAFMAYIIFG